jgi:hypothetical protein
MWYIISAIWIAATVAIYAYMVFTAREPQFDECVDCPLSKCDECPCQTAHETRVARAV